MSQPQNKTMVAMLLYKKLAIMKFLGLLLLAMSLSFGICACENDNNDDKKVSIEVLKAFEQRFPQAVQVDWDIEGKYCVAEFKGTIPDIPELSLEDVPQGTLFNLEAWFDMGANWKMTVVDVPYKVLPKAVQTGFTTSNYGAWKVEDADVIQRNGLDNVYVIEVEQGNTERYLYFNSKGVLTNEKKDNNDYREFL